MFADGEDGERGAVPLGEPVAVELVIGKPGCLEVGVVEDRPLDAGGSDVAGHAGIPDPLGHPHAGHLRLKPALEPLRRHPDLTDAVPRRQHREHRLVERTTHDLDLPFGNQSGDAVEIVGVVPVKPFGQWATGMQCQSNAGMTFKQFQERQVAVLVGLLDDAVKVADGLVVVEDEDEPDGGRHKGNRKRWR